MFDLYVLSAHKDNHSSLHRCYHPYLILSSHSLKKIIWAYSLSDKRLRVIRDKIIFMLFLLMLLSLWMDLKRLTIIHWFLEKFVKIYWSLKMNAQHKYTKHATLFSKFCNMCTSLNYVLAIKVRFKNENSFSAYLPWLKLSLSLKP